MKNSKNKFENLYLSSIIQIEIGAKSYAVYINNVGLKTARINKTLKFKNVYVNRFVRKRKTYSTVILSKLYEVLEWI